MIVVTGAYGFIGSCLVSHFNALGYSNLILVDDLTAFHKTPNLIGKHAAKVIDRTEFIVWFKKNASVVTCVFHLGARTDTTEFDYKIHEYLNLNYSKKLLTICDRYKIPFLYASSAATYGNGELGFSDEDSALSFKLKPLNAYGISKNEFDKWLLARVRSRGVNCFWAGFKFFNVYGPNEYHKKRMASTVFHFFNQINEHGAVNLFQSHRPDFADGEQQRDFIYVVDVVKILFWFFQNENVVASGLYNVGTGGARSFNAVVKNVFSQLHLPEKIKYEPTPIDIRANYQYFTEADMKKLRAAGYTESFFSLEDGIADYVTNFLKGKRYL